MDWHSWLSKSPRIDAALVNEYSLLLSRNELEEEDIPHFDHDFLQSMGISVAKHRLEILKLAAFKKDRRHRPVAAILTAIRKASNCFTRYVNGLVSHDNKSVVVVVPKPTYARGWGMGSNLMRKSRRLTVGANKGRLLLSDRICGGVEAAQPGRSPLLRSASPLVLGDREGGSWVWSTEAEGIRWDSMFQDLKPT